MEDARTSTSFQRLARTFDTLIESSKADITAIPVVRSEQFPTGSGGNIQLLVQALVCGRNAEAVGTSAKPLYRENELISSSKEVHWPRKYSRSSEGMNSHVLQRKSPKDKSFVEKPKHFFRGPEERVDPKKRKKTSQISSSLYKQE
ncbi:hypothetical protein O181_111171 [Austropuccinia psidii MF-1]|uniref:Uncharacterized protein n=1 Tax=Austropuccinia psidii MF-1 TaxID=1389203 RepID=A0A9Q3JZZ8_9BASI|nr:hypothetical protein [Austropuccinia psidii MF-1]